MGCDAVSFVFVQLVISKAAKGIRGTVMSVLFMGVMVRVLECFVTLFNVLLNCF